MSSATEFTTKKGNAAPEKEQNIIHDRTTKGKHHGDGSEKKAPVRDPKLTERKKPMDKKVKASVAGKAIKSKKY